MSKSVRADIYVRIATQGLVGFGTAPGTMATLMMIPMVYFLGSLGLSSLYYMILCALFFVCGTYVVSRALPTFNNYDASAIVLDEMVCFLFVFVSVPITVRTLIVGFGLFRVLDIIKPFGIHYLEKMPGVCGVMIDDLAAAFMSNIILHIFLYMSVL